MTSLFGVLTENIGLSRVYFDHDEAMNYVSSVQSKSKEDLLIVPARFNLDTTNRLVHKTPDKVWATIDTDGGSIVLSVEGDSIPDIPAKLLDYEDGGKRITYKKKLGLGQLLVRKKDETGDHYSSADLRDRYMGKPFKDWLEFTGIKQS